ncbi:MAG TPA: NUDIX hydrolase [Jatrophihabitans sp.]|nr:NUDIX hydrolase [Jatrophihabitans sp.]
MAGGEPVGAEVPVREAATVILLQDGAAGLETWLMRRVPKMAFAPGMSVFPGGGVDEADRAGPAVPGQAEVARRLGTTDEHAAVLLRAAVREIEEETGVRLSAADLRPWARWITPRQEKRRYDTYFFVAVLPAGALASDLSTEASVADWVPIAEALAEYERGERPMLPPTVLNLTEVGALADAAAVLAAAGDRELRPITPELRPNADGVWVADLGDGRELPLPDGFVSATGRKLDG